MIKVKFDNFLKPCYKGIITEGKKVVNKNMSAIFYSVIKDFDATVLDSQKIFAGDQFQPGQYFLYISARTRAEKDRNVV